MSKKISDFLHPPKPPSALVFYSSLVNGWVTTAREAPGPFATLEEAMSAAGPGAVVGTEKGFAAIYAMWREGAFDGTDEDR